jgi:protein SCO1/2
MSVFAPLQQIVHLPRPLAAALCAVLIALHCGLGGAVPAQAQGTSPDDLLNQVGFDQHLDAQVPLDLPFRDEGGRAVLLGDYFGQAPVVMVLAYYKCPNVCSVSLHQLSDALRQLSFAAGQQYSVVAVSIDPSETPQDAQQKKDEIIASYGRPRETSGWHFLVGGQPAIHALAQALGFRYAYDFVQRQFAHPIGAIVLTPQGRIARYFFGIEYEPRDVRLGLVEASNDTIGSPIDQLLLRCFHYDPQLGKYDLVVMNIIRLASAATVLLIGLSIGIFLWRKRPPRLAMH